MSRPPRLRVLVIAPHANPSSVATSLVGYAQSEALARQHAVTLVVRSGDIAEIARVPHSFAHVEGVGALERLYAWSVRYIFRSNYGSHALTAFTYPFGIFFECLVWLRFRRRVLARQFDVVLRVLPVTSVQPSPLAWFLRGGPVPFVIGPVNGGVPWPAGFPQAERQREWVTALRNVYRVLPFARSTYRSATAILAGSSHTFGEFRRHQDKMFLVPENGIPESSIAAPRQPSTRPLELAFVGRLVPYKACDLAIRAAAPLLRDTGARLTVIGDGPERGRLEQLASTLGVAQYVRFTGWRPHGETLEQLRHTDVLVFPSLREFGGGVVFEALAAGVVPIVMAAGGPGDIVNAEVGYRVPVTTPDQVVSDITGILGRLADDRRMLHRLSTAAIAYAAQTLTWEAKARRVTQVLAWAAGKGPKPQETQASLVGRTLASAQAAASASFD